MNGNNFNVCQSRMDILNVKLHYFITDVKKNKVASILSNKNFYDGHIKRQNLINYLDQHSPFLHVYGTNNFLNLRSYIKPIDMYMQHTVLEYYKYYLMPENHNQNFYVTEKLCEPILCECLCFYWGCPNLHEMIDERCFIRLDISDLPGSYNTIANAIENKEWEKRIDIIRKTKAKILNKYGALSHISSTIQTIEAHHN